MRFSAKSFRCRKFFGTTYFDRQILKPGFPDLRNVIPDSFDPDAGENLVFITVGNHIFFLSVFFFLFSYELAWWLNFSKTVILICSKIHCWVSDRGSHLAMKIFFSAGLQSMQLLLTGWNNVLSWRDQKETTDIVYGERLEPKIYRGSKASLFTLQFLPTVWKTDHVPNQIEQ